MAKVTFFYFNNHGRQVDIVVDKKDATGVKLFLMEAGFDENLGDIYMTDENGVTAKLDYYNEKV